jgi:hypothetical protein
MLNILLVILRFLRRLVKISHRSDHFYYSFYAFKKKIFLGDVYVAVALRGLNISRWLNEVKYSIERTLKTISYKSIHALFSDIYVLFLNTRYDILYRHVNTLVKQ